MLGSRSSITAFCLIFCTHLPQSVDDIADGLLRVEHDLELDGDDVQVLEDDLHLADAGQEELVKVHAVGGLFVLLE